MRSGLSRCFLSPSGAPLGKKGEGEGERRTVPWGKKEKEEEQVQNLFKTKPIFFPDQNAG